MLSLFQIVSLNPIHWQNVIQDISEFTHNDIYLLKDILVDFR